MILICSFSNRYTDWIYQISNQCNQIFSSINNTKLNTAVQWEKKKFRKKTKIWNNIRSDLFLLMTIVNLRKATLTRVAKFNKISDNPILIMYWQANKLRYISAIRKLN